MSSYIPKINVLYYKHILDKSFQRFFNDYNDSFVKSNGEYVFSKLIAKNKLIKIFRKYIVDEIKGHITEYSISDLNYYIIIGSCFPKDNILLKYKQDNYIPEKIFNIIEKYPNIRYFLKETDIHVDLMLFNDVFENVFEYLRERKNILKEFGKNTTNLYMMWNDRLDCKMMYETIRHIFGKVNVVNLHKKNKITDSVINSLNENIDKYVHGKHSLIDSDMMEMDRDEIRQNITNFMNSMV